MLLFRPLFLPPFTEFGVFMRLFNAICRLPGRIANAPLTMDGEGLMGYIVMVAVSAVGYLFLVEYTCGLIAEGHGWQGAGIFIGMAAFALVMLAVPFIYKPSTDMAPFETDPEPVVVPVTSFETSPEITGEVEF